MRRVVLQDVALLKEEWGSHPLCRHRLFQQPEFLQFAESVKAAEVESSEKVFAVEVEKVLPMLTSGLTSRLLASESIMRTIQEDIKKLLHGGHVITTTRISYSDGNNISSNDANSQELECSGYSTSLSRGLSSIAEIHQEWNHGINGGRSVISMNLAYGSKWRKGKGDPQRYSRRKKIIQGIKKHAERECVSEDVACAALDDLLLQKKKSVDWFAKSNELEFIIQSN